MKQCPLYIMKNLTFAIMMCFIVLPVGQAEEQIVKVGYFDYQNFLSRNVTGSYSGYGIEYLNEMSKSTGWRYEYIPGSIEENYQRLKNGEIDLLCGMKRADERAQFCDYSRYSIGVENTVMYVLPDNDQVFYEDFQAFSGLTVGVIRESVQNVLFDEYAQKHGFGVGKKYYTSNADLRKALYNHEVDAIVIGSLDGGGKEKLVARFSPMPFYYMTAKGNTRVLDKVNDALENIRNENPSFEMYLYDKYYGLTFGQLNFRREDVEFVKQWPVLRIVCDGDSEPLEYFDKDLDVYAGSYVDFLKLILERSGIRYIFVPSDSFQDRVDKLKNGEADILLSVYQNAAFAQKYNLRFTEPYFCEKNMVIGRSGMAFNESTKLTVAILEKNIDLGCFIKENYPRWQIKVYATSEDCFSAVEHGDADISMQNAEWILAVFSQNDYTGVRVVTALNAEIPISLGVSQNLPPQTVGILNKAIHSVSKRNLNELMIKNTISKSRQLSSWEFIKKKWMEIALTVAISAVFLAIAFVYIKRNRERTLSKIAYQDRLTGLRNFEKFELDAGGIIRSRNPSQYAVVYIDIEKFKYINQALGYERGNAVLLYFTKLFSHQLYADELFARVSGDRFVALLKYESQAEIASRIQEFYKSFSCIRSTLLENQRLVLVSGIYCLTKEDADIDIAVDRANLARKTVKGSHHNIFVFYDAKIHQQVAKEKEIENIMEKALQQEEFIIYLQPKYDLKSQIIVGAEALSRWKRADGTIIAPDDFIPVFERNGFIIEFDFHIFKRICVLQKKWEAEGKNIIPLSVNFSRMHINEPKFIERLQDIVRKYDVVPQNIEIEMTESAFVESDVNTSFMTEQLKKIGFILSMDDFGTGYSSLNLLREVPFDILKLDKSFLMNKEVTVKEKILISNIIRMAKELKIKVIAEGIETKEQEEFLTGLSCDMGQGYYFSRPVPIKEFEKKVWKE